MDLVYQFCGSFVKFSNPLILLHQNIRGLISSRDEIIVSLNIDKINPQFLCFSELYMSDNNLSFVSIKNYVLGSCYSRCRYQRGGVCIFVLKKLYFSHVDLSTYYVEKILELCAIKIESNGWGLVVYVDLLQVTFVIFLIC
jgi:hypothetical protein